MKKFLKSIRFMLATLLIVVVSQASVLAEGNSSAGPATGLSAGQIAGAFALLVFVILVPLVCDVIRLVSVLKFNYLANFYM